MHGTPPRSGGHGESIGNLNASSQETIALGTLALKSDTGGKKQVDVPLVNTSDDDSTGGKHSTSGRKRFLFLMTTRGSYNLRLSQIPSQNLATTSFATQLRSEYKRLRGFWRYWFSFDKFSHCDFVKACFVPFRYQSLSSIRKILSIPASKPN